MKSANNNTSIAEICSPPYLLGGRNASRVHNLLEIGESCRNFQFCGDMTLDTSYWKSKFEAKTQKVKGQGHWERKCKDSYSRTISESNEDQNDP